MIAEALVPEGSKDKIIIDAYPGMFPRISCFDESGFLFLTAYPQAQDSCPEHCWPYQRSELKS